MCTVYFLIKSECLAILITEANFADTVNNLKRIITQNVISNAKCRTYTTKLLCKKKKKKSNVWLNPTELQNHIGIWKVVQGIQNVVSLNTVNPNV